MTDQEVADKIPDGYYRVDDGEIREGDLIISPRVEGDSFEPAEEFVSVGEPILMFNVIARPMLKPSNQCSTQSRDKAKTDDKGKPPPCHFPPIVPILFIPSSSRARGDGELCIVGHLCHVYIIPQVGLVVKLFIREYNPPCTEANAKAAHAHKE